MEKNKKYKYKFKLSNKDLVFIIFCVLCTFICYGCKKTDSIDIKKYDNDDFIKMDGAVSSTNSADTADISDFTVSEGFNKSSGTAVSQIQAYSDKEDTDDADMSENKKIFVHICGSVNNPDVYELESGSRVIDAVRAAGGFRQEAAKDCINLAGILSDGERVYIPDNSEASSMSAAGELYKNGNFSENFANGLSENSKAADLSEGNKIGNDLHTGRAAGKININTAGEEELMRLKGIGKTRAGDIILYRNTHGSFNDISDIMQVPGIKQAAFDKIKDDICVK
ncbi:helix-hairpin-helix domain-containing protein [Johnsonella ignava]|nr:helix-hairpin-helix domain-containing protein [Johnsonella ignava]